MSDDAKHQTGSASGGSDAADLGAPARPRLRRRPLGYRRADVDEALEARDSELSELRQDIAALWLAFAQHDRMIRALGGETPPPLTARPAAGPTAPLPPSPSPIEAEAMSIGSQLSELDEVLAAIEMATQTLERTYTDEIEFSKAVGEDAVEPEDASSPGEEPEHDQKEGEDG